MGVYYYRARNYSSHLGAFCSRDPFELYSKPRGNVYRYVANRPIIARDPSGRVKELEYTCDTARAKLEELRDYWDDLGYELNVTILDLFLDDKGGQKHPIDLSTPTRCAALVGNYYFRAGLANHFGTSVPCKKTSRGPLNAKPGAFQVEFLPLGGLVCDYADDWFRRGDERPDFFSDIQYAIGTGRFGYQNLFVSTEPSGCCCWTKISGTIVMEDWYHFTGGWLSFLTREFLEFWEAGVYYQKYCGQGIKYRPVHWMLKCPVDHRILSCPGTLWGTRHCPADPDRPTLPTPVLPRR